MMMTVCGYEIYQFLSVIKTGHTRGFSLGHTEILSDFIFHSTDGVRDGGHFPCDGDWGFFVGIAPALSWKGTHRLLRVGCYRALSLQTSAIGPFPYGWVRDGGHFPCDENWGFFVGIAPALSWKGQALSLRIGWRWQPFSLRWGLGFFRRDSARAILEKAGLFLTDVVGKGGHFPCDGD